MVLQDSLKKDEQDFFAVFVVAAVPGGIAATTRATDRGEAGRIGLPGGKVDAGETAYQAALREAREEGWAIEGMADRPFHADRVEGRMVSWFAASCATPLEFFKESGRIRPFVASVEAVAQSGYGNDKAMRAWQALQASSDAAAANSSACSREAAMPAFAAAQTNLDATLPAIGKKASKASSRRSMRMR